MPSFDNDDALNADIVRVMSEIINEVAEKLVEKLQEIIQDVVYDPFTPEVYQRQGMNGGFIGSWTDSSETNTMGNIVTSTIESDPSKMNINREDFIHGSALSNGYISDIRDVLAEIINEGHSGDLFGDGFWREPRIFWEPFLQLLNDGTVEFYDRKCFSK